MIKDSKLLYDTFATPHDPTTFLRLIERLLYLTNTHPDISFAVQNLSQFMQNPTMHHYDAALRMFATLKKHTVLVFFCPLTRLFSLRASVTHIGPQVLCLADPQQVLEFFLVPF